MNFDFHAPRRVRVELGAALRKAEAYEFVRPVEQVPLAYRFKHVLMHEAAYESLTRHERKRLHNMTARVLEVEAGTALDEISAELTLHYAAAEDDRKTLEYATRAGDRAMRVYALAEAITFYTYAIEAAQRTGATSALWIHLFMQRGRAFELSRQFDTALSNYQAMAAVAQQHQDHAVELEAYLLRANLHGTPTTVYDPPKAQRFAEQGLALARELGDRASECKALWNLLVIYRYVGDNERASQYGEQALALARELALREQMAFIMTDLGGVYTGSGRPDLAHKLFEEARTLWRELDNKPMLADNLMLSSVQAYVSGEFRTCIQFTEEGAQISRQIGNLIGQASNQSMDAGARFELGEMANALQLGEEIRALNEQTGIQFMILLGRSALARTYAEVGALVKAQALADRASAPLEQPIPGFFRAWSFGLLAQVYILCGDLHACEQALRTSRLDSTTDNRVSPGPILADLAAARLALVQGDHDRAVKLMQDLLTALQLGGARAFSAEALYLQALGLRGQGLAEKAMEVMQEARTEAESLQARRCLWQIYAALSEWASERSQFEQANAYRNQARQIIAYILAHLPLEYHASFQNLPRVRALELGL